MKRAGNILIYMIILINLYSSGAQDCPGLNITRIARNDIDITWDRACFSDATSYLVKMTVIDSVDLNDTIVCDGGSQCTTSIRSMGWGSYINPCDNVILKVMADDKTENVTSNIAPFLMTSDWKLENSAITNSTLNARWGPPGDYNSSDVSCATKTRVTATCPDKNDENNFQDVELSGPEVQGEAEFDLVNSCHSGNTVTLTVTYMIGEKLTDTTRDTTLDYTYVPAPGAPTNITVVGNDANPTKLTVTWEKPTTSIGAGEVTGYIITYNGGTPVEMNPEAEDYEIDGLTVCTNYMVEVAAKWSGGTGESGSDTGATGSKVPGKPNNITASSTSSEISVKWEAGDVSQSCPVIGYIVDWTKVDGGEEDEHKGDGTLPGFTINGLPRTTSYNITVTVNTEDGKSAVSDVYIFTTEYSLNGGEIAGIVCGSVAGVVLIGGGVFLGYKKMTK